MCNGARGVGEKWNSRLRLARDEIYGWASMRMGSKHLLDIEQNCNHIVIYEAARKRERAVPLFNRCTWPMYQTVYCQRATEHNQKKHQQQIESRTKLYHNLQQNGNSTDCHVPLI